MTLLNDLVASSYWSHPDGFFHILSFDGGGSRGVMEAQMLKVFLSVSPGFFFLFSCYLVFKDVMDAATLILERPGDLHSALFDEDGKSKLRTKVEIS